MWFLTFRLLLSHFSWISPGRNLSLTVIYLEERLMVALDVVGVRLNISVNRRLKKEIGWHFELLRVSGGLAEDSREEIFSAEEVVLGVLLVHDTRT